MAALAALALTLITSSGDPRIGDAMTLDSIVAVVLGGTRLSGGQGGVAGSIIGVAILGLLPLFIITGDLLPWDQRGYWSTQVRMSIIASIPFAGDMAVRILQGGALTGIEMAKGLANKEIARELGIGEKTVKTHVSNILSKLGVLSRTQAALYAIQIGLVSVPPA